MFYGQYTHIKEILEKIRDEFGFEDVPMDSAMEHTWIALGKLGVGNFLEDCTEEVYIKNNRGQMFNIRLNVEPPVGSLKFCHLRLLKRAF